MFQIAYTSLHIINRAILVLLVTLGGYIITFPQKQHEFYSNLPVKWVFCSMCLGVNLPDPALSGGLIFSTICTLNMESVIVLTQIVELVVK